MVEKKKRFHFENYGGHVLSVKYHTVCYWNALEVYESPMVGKKHAFI